MKLLLFTLGLILGLNPSKALALSTGLSLGVGFHSTQFEGKLVEGQANGSVFRIGGFEPVRDSLFQAGMVTELRTGSFTNTSTEGPLAKDEKVNYSTSAIEFPFGWNVHQKILLGFSIGITNLNMSSGDNFKRTFGEWRYGLLSVVDITDEIRIKAGYDIMLPFIEKTNGVETSVSLSSFSVVASYILFK